MKQYLTIFIILLLTFSAYAKNENVATVNGKKISKKIFDQAYKQNQMVVTHKGLNKEKVLMDLINRQLGIERAKKTKLFNDQLVKRKMEDILFHAQISKDLTPLYEKIVVTDQEVKKYYKKHKEYRTAQILFRLRTNPSKKELSAAKIQVYKIYKTLKKSPSKFPELANKYSQSLTAPNGGDIGFRPAVKLAKEYFLAINNKKTSYISAPIRTQFGFHIIKVLGVKPYKDIDKLFYKKVIYDTKRDKITNDYFSKLRKNANVKINRSVL